MCGVYTFDTACFYTDQETELDHKLQGLRKRLADNKRIAQEIEARNQKIEKKESLARGETQGETTRVPRGNLKKKQRQKRKATNLKDKSIEELSAMLMSDDKCKEINTQISNTKSQLLETIQSNVDIDRHVRPEAFRASNKVAIFDSCLTRSLHMSTEDFNEQLVIVKVYYFGVAENIIKRGFYVNDEHYVFFSASAGQIRTKKFVAIKESAYEECENQLTCGLSSEMINVKGGVNINKYLAYTALCNSATTPWPEFDIDQTIVIDDFETNVPGTVDFIDDKTYEIKRQQMNVPVTHTDGCGMILPKLSKINFMVRAPWVKGLLSPFDFVRFIKEANEKDSSVNHALITDVYGVQHDVLREGIQIIFTKSQFKMWKYFDNWSQYQENFKKYGCSAGKCNEEPDYVEDATFNYQMLQTLTSMTDEELSKICEKTNRKLRNMTSDRKTMLQVFGATKPADDMNAYQKCLSYYPELLQDSYSREVLRDLKNSIEYHALGGRLDIDGKYLFLIPNLYAACQYWFGGIKEPDGLLHDGEVFCRVYKDYDKVDALRSPHLYREHAVRKNTYKENEELKRWFQTDGIYTSTWDLITKILQFDNDGDKSLVCVDPTLISVAERDCKDIVPLYYEMKKAPPSFISDEAKFNGMKSAWTSGNIGSPSNDITKVWNTPNPDLNVIKILVMEVNFIIDSAKTSYLPTRPAEWDDRIKKAISGKVPHFFVYAKDKEVKQVEPAADTLVNRLMSCVQSYKFDFKKKQLGTFDYKKLMHNPDIEIDDNARKLIDTYYHLTAQVSNQNVDISDENNTYVTLMQNIHKELSIYGDDQYITDVLVWQLFHEKKAKHKNVFWYLYGDIVYQNLLKNHAGDERMCERCGKRFVPTSPKQKYCTECAAKPEDHMLHKATCVLCGRDYVPSSLLQTICPACQFMKDNPVQTDHVAICIDCGAEFDQGNIGRGRHQQRCGRCQNAVNKEKRLKNAKAYYRKKHGINL